MLIVEALQLAVQASFKPFKLDKELREISPYLATNALMPIWDVQSNLSPEGQRVVRRAQAAVTLVALLWPILGGLGALWLGYPLRGVDVLFIVSASLLLGAVGLRWVGLSFAVNMGGAVSLAGSLVAIMARQTCQNIGFIGSNGLVAIITDPASQKIGLIVLGAGLASGLVLGMAAIATFTLRRSTWWFVGICTPGGSLVFALRFAYASSGSLEHLVVSVILAGLFALGALGGYVLGYRRFPFYLVELIWQVLLFGLSWPVTKIKRSDSGRLVRRFYRISPVTADELIWFRLWTLDRQLVWMALGGEREFALNTIVKIARSLRQGWAAEAALAAIIAHDLRECGSIPEIAKAASQLSGFPRAIDLPTLNLRRTVTLLTEVSQSADAATRASDHTGRQDHLRQAQSDLQELQETLFEMDRRAARSLKRLVRRWEQAIEQGLEGVPQEAAPTRIKNIYIAGNPIQPEHKRVLVGREDLFTKIQGNLVATQKPTLVLHGQRRMGKTSVLLQLSDRLPTNCLPVYVDLQATATVDDLNSFLHALVCETVDQAAKQRDIKLPPVKLEDLQSIYAFYEWLEGIHQRLEGQLLLFALDEFEKIEQAIDAGTLDETVLEVLSHLTQNGSWPALLFAGVHKLEEMERDWLSYFSRVKPLYVGYLNPEAARELIKLPAETYPIDYGEPTVETILEATRAQPFLVQAVCFELIQYLNGRGQRLAKPPVQVTVDDARVAINRAVQAAELYFQNRWAGCSAPEQLVLAELAHNKRTWLRIDDLGQGLMPQVTHLAVEKLARREFVERRRDEASLKVPMMRQWVQDKITLENARLACESSAEQVLESLSPGADPLKIENIFIAGRAISADEERVFVGREDLFKKIRENLDAAQKPTLVLHGQRRTGKTSLLLQLPSRLPAEYVPVYVDLQDKIITPKDGLNHLLYTLAREAVDQADKKRHIALPPVELDDFERRGPRAFYEWLEQTRQRLEGRLLLLALDEFEMIEKAIKKGKMDETVLDVLRHLIQHHSPWFVLLFAGVRTLEEMGRDWHSYFISVRPLHVSYLDLKAARELILLPTRTYPIHYDEPAIDSILQATRAQPFLLQAVCLKLILFLNSRQRYEAGPLGRVTLADTRQAIDQALRSAQPFFFDLWDRSSEPERILLAELAHRQEEVIRLDELDESVGLPAAEIHPTVEKLRRRELIERVGRECQFQVPMMRRWIQDEVDRESIRG
jgi:hypothetical protein